MSLQTRKKLRYFWVWELLDPKKNKDCIPQFHLYCCSCGHAFMTVHDASMWFHHAGSGSALAPPRACVMYYREHMSTRATGEMKLWNTIFIFVFFAQKLFSWLRKITVEPLMLHGLFYQSPWYVSGHGNISVVLLSMEGLRSLGFKQKHLNLCSDDERHQAE